MLAVDELRSLQSQWNVDEVLAFARAIHATGDGDLVKVDGQHMVQVIEHQRDLGDTHQRSTAWVTPPTA